MIQKILLATSALATMASLTPAVAGEVPIIGPVPEWVTPAPALTEQQLAQRTVAIPLLDLQTLLDGDSSVAYFDGLLAIANQEALNKLGTISIDWQPAHGDLIVHEMAIVRGKERIDLLQGGPGFSVLRREAKLEQMTLDGRLTAIMPAQGLRIGDLLRMRYSITTRDPVLGGNTQIGMTLFPHPVTMNFGRARLVWPERQKIAWKALVPGLTVEPVAIAGGRKELVIPLPIAKLVELPKNIPARFKPLPALEASSFASWQEVATLMAPLYDPTGTIAEGSDLAKVVDGIKATEADPVKRLAAALRVVQDDVRYQLIAMGTGNYMPQKPAETWQVRYGDCKAKTLLLLAMLQRLGITAEAALAHSKQGDVVPTRLPSAQAFDHVFVHATIKEEDFWLDGTSLGDRLADIRNVPRFGHVLPLRVHGAQLVALPTKADARPAMSVTLDSDASAGLHLPVPFKLSITFTGAAAEQRRAEENAASAESLKELAEKNAKRLVDSSTITTPTASYDKEASSWTMQVSGLSYPDWTYEDGRWTIEYSSMTQIDFEPDRSKASWRHLPALIPDPWTSQASWSMKLPERARTTTIEGTEPMVLDLPSVSYRRSINHDGIIIRSLESTAENGAETPPGEIGASRKAIESIAAKKLRLFAPANYPHRWDEVELARSTPALQKIRQIFDQRIAAEPNEAERYADRGWLATRLFEWAAAEADYTKAIALDPTLERYLKRAGVRSDRGDFAGMLKDAQAAYDLDADNKDARAWLASALSHAGKTDAALELIDADADLASEEGENALVSRAQTLADGGRGSEAIALLDEALEKRPSSARLLNSRCWVKGLINSGLDEALLDCNRAIEIEAQPAGTYDSRAMVHYRAGRFALAKTDLRSALAIAPEIAASHYMLGVIALREGDKSAATASLAAARKLFPAVGAYFARFGIKP